jgi:hypothetical protein
MVFDYDLVVIIGVGPAGEKGHRPVIVRTFFDSSPIRGTEASMSSIKRVSLSTLVLAVVVPLAWVACGGSKPPETPSDEKANADGGETPAAESASAAPAASAAADSSATAAPPPSATAAASPPAAPALGDSDCGKCLDKICAKQVKACGKNTDCQSTLDGIHSCGSDTGAAACIGAANPPTGAKPKKLATAYETCAKKAVAKACKAKCQ